MYLLYDYYEGQDLIGKYDDWFEMKKAKEQYVKDTDGECDLEVVFIDEEK